MHNSWLVSLLSAMALLLSACGLQSSEVDEDVTTDTGIAEQALGSTCHVTLYNCGAPYIELDEADDGACLNRASAWYNQCLVWGNDPYQVWSYSKSSAAPHTYSVCTGYQCSQVSSEPPATKPELSTYDLDTTIVNGQYQVSFVVCEQAGVDSPPFSFRYWNNRPSYGAPSCGESGHRFGGSISGLPAGNCVKLTINNGGVSQGPTFVHDLGPGTFRSWLLIDSDCSVDEVWPDSVVDPAWARNFVADDYTF